MNKRTILISGASGLLGKELVTQLLQLNNYNVIALTSRVEELKSEFKVLDQLTVLDVNDWMEKDKPSNIDVFINCAFPRSSNPEALAKGILFTERIIKDALEVGVNKIINISSQSVYSQKSKDLTTETSIVSPENLYGMAKYSCERLVERICVDYHQKVYFSNIRLASLTGIDFDVRMTNRFVKNTITNTPITINGGEQLISYLEVRDAAEALITMAEKDAVNWSNVYNLGNNESFSLLELVDIIKKNTDKLQLNSPKTHINNGDSNFSNLISSDLFYRDFNWKPRYNVDLMVEELFELYTK